VVDVPLERSDGAVGIRGIRVDADVTAVDGDRELGRRWDRRSTGQEACDESRMSSSGRAGTGPTSKRLRTPIAAPSSTSNARSTSAAS